MLRKKTEAAKKIKKLLEKYLSEKEQLEKEAFELDWHIGRFNACQEALTSHKEHIAQIGVQEQLKEYVHQQLEMLIETAETKHKQSSPSEQKHGDDTKILIGKVINEINVESSASHEAHGRSNEVLFKAMDALYEKLQRKIGVYEYRYKQICNKLSALKKPTIRSLATELEDVEQETLVDLITLLENPNTIDSQGNAQIREILSRSFGDLVTLLRIHDQHFQSGIGYSSFWDYTNSVDEKENSDGVFIYVSKDEDDGEALEDEAGQKEQEAVVAANPIAKGWKLHVGINDTDVKNLSMGWNIVKDICIKYKINQLKVVAPKYFMAVVTGKPHTEGFCEGLLAEKTPSQRNKQITIYCDDNSHISVEQWWGIIQEITSGLAEAGVEPAPFTRIGERQIAGSNYISYRNELDKDGNYHNISALARYNLSSSKNPFKRYTVKIDREQPEYQSPEVLEIRKLLAENKGLKTRVGELEPQASSSSADQPPSVAVGTTRPSIQKPGSSGESLEKDRKEKRSKKKHKSKAGKAESGAAGSGDKEKKKEKKQQLK